MPPLKQNSKFFISTLGTKTNDFSKHRHAIYNLSKTHPADPKLLNRKLRKQNIINL